MGCTNSFTEIPGVVFPFAFESLQNMKLSTTNYTVTKIYNSRYYYTFNQNSLAIL
jgi:hypothetical protein